MHFRPPIIGMGIGVFAEPIHAGQRGDADERGGLAENSVAANIHGCVPTGGDEEAVGAGHARAVEQGVNGELRGAGCRAHEPELFEDRNSSPTGFGGVERQTRADMP